MAAGFTAQYHALQLSSRSCRARELRARACGIPACTWMNLQLRQSSGQVFVALVHYITRSLRTRDIQTTSPQGYSSTFGKAGPSSVSVTGASSPYRTPVLSVRCHRLARWLLMAATGAHSTDDWELGYVGAPDLRCAEVK